VKLADLGSVKEVEGRMATHSGEGSVAYSAPEMFDQRIGPASDIYALGVMTFELLTGRLPFTGTPQAIAMAHLSTAPAIPVDLPRMWMTLLTHTLEKEPSSRWSALRVVEHLEAWHEGDVISQPARWESALLPAPVPIPERAVDPVPAAGPSIDDPAGRLNRRPLPARLAVGAALVLLAFAGGWLVWRPTEMAATRDNALRAAVEDRPAEERSGIFLGAGGLDSAPMRSPLITGADLESAFFSGNSSGAGRKTTFITLLLTDVRQAGSSGTFHYTLMSATRRESGQGRLDFQQAVFELDNGVQGRIQRSAGGRLVISSLQPDSGPQWTLMGK
jgi:hypothetical protein